MSHVPHVKALLSGARWHVEQCQPRRAVRQILITTDEWMREKKIERCALLLQLADPFELQATASLALLAALAPVKAQLAAERADFIVRLRAYLAQHHPTELAEMTRGIV